MKDLTEPRPTVLKLGTYIESLNEDKDSGTKVKVTSLCLIKRGKKMSAYNLSILISTCIVIKFDVKKKNIISLVQNLSVGLVTLLSFSY